MWYIDVAFMLCKPLIRYVMAASRGQKRLERDRASTDLVTGSLIDDFTRKAQERCSGNGINANLTSVGASIHGIEQSDELTVLVFEEGIWISPQGDE